MTDFKIYEENCEVTRKKGMQPISSIQSNAKYKKMIGVKKIVLSYLC